MDKIIDLQSVCQGVHKNGIGSPSIFDSERASEQ